LQGLIVLLAASCGRLILRPSNLFLIRDMRPAIRDFSMPIVTISSDFGLQDEYVGVMKGVILSISPAVSIVDVTHEIDAQDVVQAAFLIPSFYRFFPPGTVHLVVVDPGVGGERDILGVSHQGHVFIAPDNGVLTLLMDREKSDSIVRITNAEYFLNPVSGTFHGRDIFAPVGAHIINGLALKDLGLKVESADIIHLENLKCRLSESGELCGRIISVDRFGNLITNIDLEALTAFGRPESNNRLRIRISAHQIQGLSDCYSNGPRGEPLALVGSRNYLEIAVNCGSAEKYFRAQKGDCVQVTIL
jgi:S-adenosylmethionine hydrolase